MSQNMYFVSAMFKTIIPLKLILEIKIRIKNSKMKYILELLEPRFVLYIRVAQIEWNRK